MSAGGELVRHIDGRLIAAHQRGRGAAVECTVVHRRLDGGGDVRQLGVYLVTDVLVGRVDVGGAVVSCDLGAPLYHLVEATDLNVALAEKGNEIVEAVVHRARPELHDLVLKVLLLLDL